MKKYLYGIALFILVCVGLIVYGPSLSNGFVWDDEEQIVNNTVIRDLKNFPVIFSGGAFYSGGTGKLLGIYYKPLMTLTFALIYRAAGLNPMPYHLISLLFHITNAYLVFFLLTRFFRKRISLPLSLLFLVHPLTSEVVLYAAATQDVLYFFFGMLGLLIGGPLSALLFLASLLSKETGIVFIIVSVLYRFLYDRKQMWWTIAAGVFAVAAYALLRFGLAHIYFPDHDMAPIARLTFTERLLNIPAVFSYFVTNFFVPVNLAVSQQWIVRSVTLTSFVVPFMLIISTLTAGTYIAIRKKHALFFFLLFLFGMLPHLQIFPLDVTVSGRWMYVAGMGLLGLIGTILPRRFLYLLLVPIVIFSGISFRRTFDYADGLTFYSADLKTDPDNFNLENNLGVELYRIGKTGEAAEHFARSIELNPSWWTHYNNLGAYWEQRGDLAKAESLYKQSIDRGNYYLAYENYAGILIRQKKFDAARTFLDDALRYFPENQRLHSYKIYLDTPQKE